MMILGRHLAAASRDQRGLTLIELVVVMLILGAVIGAIVTLFTSALKSEVDLTARVRAQEEARLALDTLRRDVHCASETSGLTENVASSTVTFVLPTGCPSAVTEHVTWCTRLAAANRHTLYRVTGNDCSAAGGVTYADFFTASEVFTYVKPGESRAHLEVVFLVDTDPSSPSQAYALRDALVLRNSER